MSKVFTYCRVSTTDQNLDAQQEELKKAYPDAIEYTEKASATSLENRPELQQILKVIGDGDVLVVWKLDRLARNMEDLLKVVNRLKKKGAKLKVLTQPVDTTTPAGDCFILMLGVFAEFETNLRAERQAIGIAKAKREGKYKGKQANLAKHAEVKEYLEKGYPVSEIVKLTGMGKSNIYKIRSSLA